MIDFLVKSGRALVFPIYKDTYERLGTPPDSGTIAERDETIQQADDLRRSVDYLQTRDDIDHDKLGFFTISWGGQLFPILTALEPRFKAIAIWSGGCDSYKVLPEADPMNFAPRVKAPVLMINGRYDFGFPLETCQEPFFRALGSQAADKKHILYDSAGDGETLSADRGWRSWAIGTLRCRDQYRGGGLGPVRTGTAVPQGQCVSHPAHQFFQRNQ